MIPVMCFVQEGQISANAEATLKREIRAFSERAFQEPADIDWIVVRAGNGFTAARPSTSVIASMQANAPLAHREREAMLKELSEICVRATVRSPKEIVACIRDPQ